MGSRETCPTCGSPTNVRYGAACRRLAAHGAPVDPFHNDATPTPPAPADDARPSRVHILPLVLADLSVRIEKGARQYGEPLTAHNGRDALQDAYEEAMDLALYLKQAIIERTAPADDAPRESAPASGEVFVYRPASWKGQAPDNAKGRDDVPWVAVRADQRQAERSVIDAALRVIASLDSDDSEYGPGAVYNLRLAAEKYAALRRGGEGAADATPADTTNHAPKATSADGCTTQKEP